MTGIDILLIVIGAILVTVSFIISEKISSGRAGNAESGREIWSGRDEITIKDRVNIVLADKSEQIINDTEERLCHLSNEKIMEFQEYSEQVNEKLNENHNQSVFLYKMLTEKQNEMKEWISELDSKYAGIKNEFNSLEIIINKIKQIKKKDSQKEKKTDQVKKAVEADEGNVRTETVQEEIVPAAADTAYVEASPAEDMDKPDAPDEERHAGEDGDPNMPQKALMTNKNEKILDLFDSGKSLLEISKQLGMGQGEVKLVLDLYRGNKK